MWRLVGWGTAISLAFALGVMACATGDDGRGSRRSSSSSSGGSAGAGGGAGGGVDGPPSTHFAQQPLDFSVPTLGDGYGFYATGHGSWATQDIDGDGMVDLVHTADPDTGLVWGGDANPSWHVYSGDAAGFAATWRSWKVPSLGNGEGFYALAGYNWATLDLDDDGHLDLVHTEDPATGKVWGGDANPSWRVYWGQTDGFAPTPTSWSVPTLGDGYGFYAVTGGGWATLDLDHDGRVDLVHSADPMTGRVWGGDTNATWRVYLGQEGGFAATPTTWKVPAVGEGDLYGFYAVASTGWATLDLDSDGQVDLVHTVDPTSSKVWGGDSNASWRVYLGQAQGFAPVATTWKVPTLGDGYGFKTTASELWATIDIDGDHHLDLVHTADPMNGSVWGGDDDASWRVYLGEASGFAPLPNSWAVPTLGDGYGFYAVTSTSWSTLDMDGDGHVDLVHTADPMSGGVWGGDESPFWKVFRGEP